MAIVLKREAIPEIVSLINLPYAGIEARSRIGSSSEGMQQGRALYLLVCIARVALRFPIMGQKIALLV